MSLLTKNQRKLPRLPRRQACFTRISIFVVTLLSSGILYAQRPPGYIGPPTPNPIRGSASPPGPRVALGPTVLPNRIINDRSLQQPGESQSELSVAAFGEIVVAGFNDCSGFRDPTIRNGIVGWGFSADGGFTWRDLGRAGALPLDNPGDSGTQGDPSLDVDANGNFYFANIYQRISDRTVGVFNVSVHKGRFDAVSGKVVFDRPTFATNFTSGLGTDKEHLGVDRGTGYVYVSYSNYSAPLTGQIEIVRSTDGGRTWDGPVVIARGDGTVRQGSIPRIGPNGEIYVAWEDGIGQPTPSIHIRKSTNWPNFGPDITVSSVTPVADPGPPPRGINEFPTMAIDTTNGPNRG